MCLDTGIKYPKLTKQNHEHFFFINAPNTLSTTDLYLVLGFRHFQKNSPSKQRDKIKMIVC